jgi:hypothetical protein
MSKDSFHYRRLRLDEGEHLVMKFIASIRPDVRIENVRTSAGFLLKKTALILAKWEAMTICVFISSDDLSKTVSQNGTSSRDE